MVVIITVTYDQFVVKTTKFFALKIATNHVKCNTILNFKDNLHKQLKTIFFLIEIVQEEILEDATIIFRNLF